jgi:hypothetical protein
MDSRDDEFNVGAPEQSYNELAPDQANEDLKPSVLYSLTSLNVQKRGKNPSKLEGDAAQDRKKDLSLSRSSDSLRNREEYYQEESKQMHFAGPSQGRAR